MNVHCCNILLFIDIVKTMYFVLVINKAQSFSYLKHLSFLNVPFEFKLSLNSNSSFEFKCPFKLLVIQFNCFPQAIDQKRSCPNL
jgi:hypothetical protein